eukprot:TRINITY_DN13914_c0_g1_i1.p1 TRINITY_DN13914_c0_g1~~TRINITY_DN13914_c0_g1_i1.p1  ORF type:complete len:1070 (-),score=317.92 TRINITY_DN13914_c0_g1_i1:107-3316(-)
MAGSRAETAPGRSRPVSGISLPKVAGPCFSQPSCWGFRGPPCRLRKLALGVPLPDERQVMGRAGGAALPQLPVTAPATSSSSRGFDVSPPTTVQGGADEGRTLLPFGHERSSMSCSAGHESFKSEKARVASWRILRRPRRLNKLDGGRRKGRGAKRDSSRSSLRTSSSFLGGDPSTSSFGSMAAGTKPDFSDLARTIRDELASCASARDVEQLSLFADRVLLSNSSEQLGRSGRFSYRLREAQRMLTKSGSFDLHDVLYQLKVRKLLARESERRLDGIAAGEQPKRVRIGVLGMVGAVGQNLLDASGQVVHSKSGQLGRQPSFGHPLQTTGSSGDLLLPSGVVGPQLSSAAAEPSSLGAEKAKGAASQSQLPTVSELETDVFESRISGKHRAAVKPIEDHRSLEEEVWLKVFEKVKDDGEVHRDELPKAVEIVGLGVADMNCLDDAFDQITRFTTLKRDEFIRFLRIYKDNLEKLCHDSFKAADCDGSGSVEVDELRGVLADLGVEPMDHVLQQVVTEVDENGSGALEYVEFREVLWTLKNREGFSKQEYEDFLDLFAKHDLDGSGEMDSQELGGILSWLGFAIDQDTVEELVKAVDRSGDGTMCEREYLACMRKVREREVAKIVACMNESDADGSGTVNYAELANIMHALGFPYYDPDALKEAAAYCGFAGGEEQEFDLSQLWRVLAEYRQREGFIEAELNEFSEAFTRYDKGEKGEIMVQDIGKLLRWLGYGMPFDAQKQLIARVDIDGSGKVSLSELQKLIRLYQNTEMQRAKKVFDSCLEDGSSDKKITRAQCTMAYKQLGALDATDHLLKSKKKKKAEAAADGESAEAKVPAEDEGVDFQTYMLVFMKYKRESRSQHKENCGFGAEEVEHLRSEFARYDNDGSGDISSKELVKLIEECFPALAADVDMRPKLIHLLQEVDQDGNGSLDFQDFLRLIMQFLELAQRDQIEREQKAIEETGFAAKEVEEFRELFLASPNLVEISNGKMLPFDEVRRMLGTICPLGDKNLGELNAILQRMVSRTRPKDHTADSVTFPEFLLLMSALLKSNFAGIKESTRKFGADPNA